MNKQRPKSTGCPRNLRYVLVYQHF